MQNTEKVMVTVFMQGSSSCQPGDSIHLVFPPVENIMPVSWDCFWDELFFKRLAAYSVYCTQLVTNCCLISIPVSFPLTLPPAFSPALILPLKLQCFMNVRRQTTILILTTCIYTVNWPNCMTNTHTHYEVALWAMTALAAYLLLWQAELKTAVITCAGWLTHYLFY